MTRVVIAKRALVAHPDMPPGDYAVGAKLCVVDGTILEIEYVVTGSIDAIVWPLPTAGARRDGLWRHSCFELFARGADGGYFELNFAPSLNWASYRFDGYREGMRDAEDVVPIDILPEWTTAERFGMVVRIDLTPLRTAGVDRLGLSAVIEEKGGAKSYWALKHPVGAPDFHHPDCFAFELPAPEAP